VRKTLGILAVALLIGAGGGAGGLAPREVDAQGACEAAAALAPALAGAGAVGALGETVTNVFDRAVGQIEQAEAGGPDAQGEGDENGGAAPRPPRPTVNEPPPLIAGC
jgi:hypothetical protein